MAAIHQAGIEFRLDEMAAIHQAGIEFRLDKMAHRIISTMPRFHHANLGVPPELADAEADFLVGILG